MTAGSAKEARTIARAVLKAKLAACVNIVPGIESHYWWQGKMERSSEHLLLIKSSRLQFARLTALVKKTHSYQTPEIIAVPLAALETSYAKWWRESLG